MASLSRKYYRPLGSWSALVFEAPKGQKLSQQPSIFQRPHQEHECRGIVLTNKCISNDIQHLWHLVHNSSTKATETTKTTDDSDSRWGDSDGAGGGDSNGSLGAHLPAGKHKFFGMYWNDQSDTYNRNGHISLCIWGISPTIFVSLPQQNCFISPTICFVSPTKLLHFPNNLSHFPNNLCHFPNTFSHFPNNFVSLCPPPKNHDFLKKNLGFYILISLHHF